jgi:hypothetical protein
MTFADVVKTTPSTIDKLIYSYTEAAYPPHMESLRLWSIQAKYALLLRFEVSTHPTTESDRNPESTESKTGTYFVISTPINHVHGIFSRSTRVYLAIHKDDFEAKKFHPTFFRTLKLSWQTVLRHPEYDFYQRAKLRNGGNPIKYLANAITGGRVKSTLQRNGRFIYGERATADSGAQARFISPLHIESVIGESHAEYIEPRNTEDYCNGMRELHWIIFENVGKPLQAFVDVRQPIQALRDALEGV